MNISIAAVIYLFLIKSLPIQSNNFSFLSFNQYMFWLTFSPIAISTEKYYQVTEVTVDLLLNWGPIIFVFIIPFVYLLVNSHHGLRRCVLISAMFLLIASFIRLIPSIILSPSNPNFHQISVPFLHFGQILIATTGPICMGLLSQLSCLWFPLHERTRATAIILVSGNLGAALAFLVSSKIVYEPSRVSHLLYLHAGLAILACICTLIYFPAEPPSPPSPAAELLIAERFRRESLSNLLRRSLSDILYCFKDTSCVLLVLSNGLVGGTIVTWNGLFVTIFTPSGYTESQAGWFGFGQAIGGIIGALIFSYLADQPRFQRSFKSLLLFLYIGLFISCLIVQLSIRTLLWPDHPPFSLSVFSLGIVISITGFFSGGLTPLIYECLAEMMHPLPESLTALLSNEIFNITSLILLAIAPNRYKLINFLVILVIGIGTIMVSCIRVTYRRKDEEQRKKSLLNCTLEQSMDL